MEMVRTTMRDARFALRLLAKNPGFALVAILTLALGIGANTAAFSWIQSVLLRSLPGVQEPDRMVVIAPRHSSGSTIDTMSYPDVRDLNERKDIFEGVLASQYSLSSLGSGEDRTWVWGQVVSKGFFELLGLRPAVGRFFLPEENSKPGSEPVIVISHQFWKNKFAGDPKIVGQSVNLNEHNFTIVGVAPPEFLGTMGGLSFDFWAPLTMHEALGRSDDGPSIFEKRGARWLHTIGKLAPGVSISQAQAAVGTLSRAWEKEFPTSHRAQTLQLFPLWNAPWGAPKVMLPVLSVLFVVTLLALFIVAANFANLLLARAAVRAREISVRMALGGSRARLVRQLLTESVTLAGLGCGLGIPCAIWMTDSMKRMFPKMYLPVVFAPQVDWRSLVFMIVVALAIGIIFGLAPAWHATKTDLVSGLKEGSRGNSSTRAWLRSALIIAQVAMAVLLVIGGALCFQSFRYARTMSRGFAPEGVLIANVRLFAHKYDAKTGAEFFQRLTRRLRELPGVESSALGDYVPLGPEGGGFSRIVVKGYATAPGENLSVPLNTVTPGYFNTLRIPLLDGRDFADTDDSTAPLAIIVNDTFAQRFWPNQSAIGRKVTIFGDRLMTVIGVVGTIKIRNLNEPKTPFFYIPLRQVYTPTMNIHLRTRGNPVAFESVVRDTLHSLDPAVHPAVSGPMTQVTDFAMTPFKVASVVLVGLSGAAVFLAVMGIYGLIAFSVTQRRVEIGIRMALGAQASNVLALILRQGLILSSLGVIVGLAGAFALTRLISGILVGVSAADPMTFLCASLFFILVALAASYIPARRAAAIDPLVALKCE